jgi:hypothetical protein
LTLPEVKNMVGLESSMDNATAAQKTKKPEVDSAEKDRQKKFMEQLRRRSVPQPKGGK